MKKIYAIGILSLLTITGGANTISWHTGSINAQLDTITGLMTLVGAGRMPDYNVPEDWPWNGYRHKIRSIAIGNGVESVGNYSFYLTNIRELQIPASVVSIGTSAFQECSLLSIVSIGGAAAIGDNAFMLCQNLVSVTTAAGLQSIGAYAFNQCVRLPYFVIKEGPAAISEGAFMNCIELRQVVIPSSVATIDSIAFAGCDSLRVIYNYRQTPQALGGNAFRDINRSRVSLFLVTSSTFVYGLFQEAANGWAGFNTHMYNNADRIVLAPRDTIIAKDSIVPIRRSISPNSASQRLIWKSSDNAIARVDTSGVLTAAGVGSAVIWAQTIDGSDLIDSIIVRIVIFPVSISLNKYSTTIVSGAADTLHAYVLPQNATYRSVLWTSSDTRTAVVDALGRISARAAGQAVITAQIENDSHAAQCSVRVILPAIPIERIVLNKHTMELGAGEAQTLTATIFPSNADNKDIRWSSDNERVAAVDITTGRVVGQSAGSAVIAATAYYGAVTDTCSVVVRAGGATAVTAAAAAVLQVYPNPAAEYLCIVNGDTHDEIEVYNYAGMLVASYDAAEQETCINIGHLSAGIYIVKAGGRMTKAVKK
jgi:uncharacterized protein YjdB